jgi:hypothetical protein
MRQGLSYNLLNHFFLRIDIRHKFHNAHALNSKVIAHKVHNRYNCGENEIKEIELVVTFKLSVATCGKWRQGWTPLS